MTDEQLKQALLRGIPDETARCHQRFGAALRSVKEDEPVKRNVFVTAALTLAIICLTVGAALGAAQLLDGAPNQDYTTAAQPTDTIAATPSDFVPVEDGEPQPSEPDAEPLAVWELGPVRISFVEAGNDGQMVSYAFNVRMADGSDALFLPAGNPLSACLGDMLGECPWPLEKGVSFLDAARQLDLPLYRITVINMASKPVGHFSAPKQGLWETDGSLTIVDELSNPSGTDAFASQLYLRVTPIDRQGNALSEREWRANADIVAGAPRIVAEYRYQPTAPVTLETDCGRVRLVDVVMQATHLTTYISVRFEPLETAEVSQLTALNSSVNFTDMKGGSLELNTAVLPHAAFADGYYTVTDAYYLSKTPDSLVLFDRRGTLHTGPIVVQLVP